MVDGNAHNLVFFCQTPENLRYIWRETLLLVVAGITGWLPAAQRSGHVPAESQGRRQILTVIIFTGIFTNN